MGGAQSAPFSARDLGEAVTTVRTRFQKSPTEAKGKPLGDPRGGSGGAGVRDAIRLCFRAGDGFGAGDFAKFREQRDGVGTAFDGPRLDSIRAVGDAVGMAVEDSQRDEAFAMADRDQRWGGGEHPRVGQHLQRGGEAQLIRTAFARQRRLQQGLTEEVVGQQPRPEFLSHGGGRLAAEHVEFHRRLDVAQLEFDHPAAAI